jgi:hypothetical protein
MLPELIFSILIFAAVFLLLFKSNLPARWKYVVQQTVTGALIIWLLAMPRRFASLIRFHGFR